VLVALVVPLGLALHVWHVERREFTPTELARLAFQPPRWWGMWWPDPLRRPGDLWPHLPWQARFVRRGLSACVVALPLLVLAQRRVAVAGGSVAYDWAMRYVPAAEWAVALCAAVLTGGALAWSRVQGLTAREATQLLFGATMPSSAWRAPNVAHLLGPASHDVRPPERDDAADHARAVAELTRLLPPEVGRVGADAADVAHRVAAAVAQADRELGALARDAGAAEIDRLATRLTGLEDAAAYDEDHDRGELRELVRCQLDLLHRMRRRHESLSHRRTQLLDLARGIWTQLYALHDTTPGAPGRRDEMLARARAVCAEAAALLEASPPAATAKSRRHDDGRGLAVECDRV
jgi:signal transduction histidine kinase